LRFDVVVVGGGSTGCSIAYHLCKEGAGKVALVEREYVAWGQTGRSTAVVRLHYSTPQVAKMALISWEFLRDMPDKLGKPSGFKAVGFAIMVDEHDIEGLRKNVEMQKSIGINTKLISPEELKEIMPYLRVDDLAGAAYEPESGYADPVITAQSLAEAAKELGCEIMAKTEVIGFEVKGSRIEKVKTTRGDIQADYIVNATGVWTNTLNKMLGLELPVEVVKEEIVIWKRPDKLSGEHPVIGDLPNDYYMRPFGDTQTYMGSINPRLETRAVEPSAFNLDERVGIETFRAYGEKVVRRIPDMAEAGAAGGWIGLYDITPDWHPIIGKSEKIENLVHAVGLSGHGFKLCPAIGQTVAEIILKNGKTTIVEPEFFSEKRFKTGKLIGTSYAYGVIS